MNTIIKYDVSQRWAKRIQSTHPMWIIWFDIWVVLPSILYSGSAFQRSGSIISFSGAILLVSAFVPTIVKLDLHTHYNGYIYPYDWLIEVYGVVNHNNPKLKCNPFNRAMLGFCLALLGTIISAYGELINNWIQYPLN